MKNKSSILFFLSKIYKKKCSLFNKYIIKMWEKFGYMLFLTLT